jgi:D-alanyl-D-alanine carboxypeptidase/D-alanyl-D-alanine-endopeptidase (penicillin-binding protein 4)
MHIFYRSFFLLCILLTPLFVCADELLPQSVKKALLSSKIPDSSLGFHVRPIGKTHSQTSSYAWNSNLALNPASTMKLVTTIAALDILGPQYRWNTNLYTNGFIDQGILYGNLIWQGFGDPKLVPEQLSQIVNYLRQSGIQEIQGNLVFDRTIYSSSVRQSAPLDGESNRTYNVVPDPLLYSFQTLSFRISNQGGQADITYTPRLAGLKVINQLQITKGACTDWTKSVKISIRKINDDEWQAIFAGPISGNCLDINWNSVSIDANQFFKQGILAAWEDAGGVWKSSPQIIEAEVPAQAKLLYSHQGTLLADAVRDINKYSNNVMARQLMLTIGVEKGLRPSSTTDSVRLIKDWLKKSKLNFPELVIENGSGLSNIERISSQSMTALLNYAIYSKHNQVFISSLPIAGVDGTMKNRLLDRLRKLWATIQHEDTFSPDLSIPSGLHKTGAYMKTGTLQTVRAVSGYVVSKSGKVYAVSSTVNHANASLGGTSVNDALISWVLDDCPSN